MTSRRVLPLLALAGLPGPCHAVPPVYELKLAGSCDSRLHLDGLSFKLQGHTATGSPYWRALAPRDQAVFLYHDPDCDGNKDGTPRWIIDTDQPSLTALEDLDGDQKCHYLARINSEDATHPPAEGVWHMGCGTTAADWRDHDLILLGITTTQTTMPHGEAKDEGHTQPHGPSAPAPAGSTTKAVGGAAGALSSFRLEGACAYKGSLNGVDFAMLGRTADGAPYYRASTGLQYLYYDGDCDGEGGDEPVGKWVLDKDAPSLARLNDLDGDGRCDYHGRLAAEAGADRRVGPPRRAMWRMYCGPDANWRDVILTLRRPGATAAAAAPLTSTRPAGEAALTSAAASPALWAAVASTAAAAAVAAVALG